MEEIRELVEKYALQNAVKYKAAPNAGAVMGKLLGEHQELRSRAKELPPLIKEVLAVVEKTSLEEWQERLQAIAPQLLAERSLKRRSRTRACQPFRERKMAWSCALHQTPMARPHWAVRGA